MPQATEEQRKLWGGRNGVGEDKAENFLQSHGYILQRNWTWKKPTPTHTVTQEEYEAICFLIDEWDYGGIFVEKRKKYSKSE
jgi:hypothetical protein